MIGLMKNLQRYKTMEFTEEEKAEWLSRYTAAMEKHRLISLSVTIDMSDMPEAEVAHIHAEWWAGLKKNDGAFWMNPIEAARLDTCRVGLCPVTYPDRLEEAERQRQERIADILKWGFGYKRGVAPTREELEKMEPERLWDIWDQGYWVNVRPAESTGPQITIEEILADTDATDEAEKQARADKEKADQEYDDRVIECHEMLAVSGFYDPVTGEYDHKALRRIDYRGSDFEDILEDIISGMNRIQRILIDYRKRHPAPYNKIKIGMGCHSCKHATKKDNQTVTCALNNKGRPIPAIARCAKWQLTLDPARLKRYEKRVDTKNLLQAPKVLKFYYHNDRIGVKDNQKVSIGLGLFCFVCKHRGKLNNNKIDCQLRDKKVWVRATCGGFELNNKPVAIERLAKTFRKYGLPAKGSQWVHVRLAGHQPKDKPHLTNRQMWDIFYKGRASNPRMDGWKGSGI